MIAIEPFDAKYITHREDDSKAWKPCRVVGVSNSAAGHQWLVVLVPDDDGRIYATEMSEVFGEDAEMPTTK